MCPDHSKPSSNFLTGRSRAVFILWIFYVICFCLFHAVMSISCSLVVTCWERADLLTFLYVMSSCVFATFSFVVLVQVWYLIVSIPDICLLPYFVRSCMEDENIKTRVF